MRKLHRQREVERLRLQRKTKVDVRFPTDYHWELHYPDESRNWAVFVGHCPMCGAASPMRLEVRKEPGKKPQYRVCCTNGFSFPCGFATEWFERSQHAIQNWKVLAALKK